MKLVHVKRESARGVSSQTTSTFNINAKGSFFLNAYATKKLGIVKGSSASLHQDEGDAKKWYFRINKEGDCSIYYKVSGATFNARNIQQKIFEAFDQDPKKSLKFTIGMAVSYEGVDYYPLNVIKLMHKVKIDLPEEKPYKFSKNALDRL